MSALGLLFRDRVQQMRIRLMRNHVVVCGLGGYVGIVFLRHLHEDQFPVVVIELDAANPNIELCRTLGIPVIVGDAQRRRILQAAGAQRASRVLAITAEDAVNTQIVAMVRELAVDRSRQLRCLAMITNPEFCRLLRVQEAQRGDPELSVDFFNIDEISARLLLEDFPVDTSHGQPHIVVAHLDPLGVWLVYHAARAWCWKRGDSRDPLVVTVFDHQPNRIRVEALLGQHPALEKGMQIRDFLCDCPCYCPLACTSPGGAETPPISRAYVTSYRDVNAFETALQLRHELDPTIPVVAALSRLHGVAGLLDYLKEAGALSNIDVSPEAGTQLHDWGTGARGVVRADGAGHSSALAPRSDRQRLDGTEVAGPRPIPQGVQPQPGASHPDPLAQGWLCYRTVTGLGCQGFHLHRRGNQRDSAIAETQESRNRERSADGWTLADEKNVERKETPYLLPWERLKELYPDIAELRRYVYQRAMPEILASAGLQIIRTPV